MVFILIISTYKSNLLMASVIHSAPKSFRWVKRCCNVGAGVDSRTSGGQFTFYLNYSHGGELTI